MMALYFVLVAQALLAQTEEADALSAAMEAELDVMRQHMQALAASQRTYYEHCVHVCVCVCMCLCVYVYMSMCTCAYVCI